jgi:acyl dehydratase
VTTYFEDFKVGDVIESGRRTVTKDEIIAFAQQFDPQSFHIDEDKAAASKFGGLVASGWHTCALCMRLMVDSMLNDSNNLGSPGVEKIRFLKPLRPGATIHATARVVEAIPSKTRPDRGRLTFLFELYAQGEGLILDMLATAIFAKRPVAP